MPNAAPGHVRRESKSSAAKSNQQQNLGSRRSGQPGMSSKESGSFAKQGMNNGSKDMFDTDGNIIHMQNPNESGSLGSSIEKKNVMKRPSSKEQLRKSGQQK